MDEMNNSNEQQQTKQKKAPRTAAERLAALEAKEAKAKEAERRRKSEMNRLKKEMQMKKQEALIHNLTENGITTENEVKALCIAKQLFSEFGIENSKNLREILDAAKRTAPQLFSNPSDQGGEQ